jgi:hypothetical protein
MGVNRTSPHGVLSLLVNQIQSLHRNGNSNKINHNTEKKEKNTYQETSFVTVLNKHRCIFQKRKLNQQNQKIHTENNNTFHPLGKPIDGITHKKNVP